MCELEHAASNLHVRLEDFILGGRACVARQKKRRSPVGKSKDYGVIVDIILRSGQMSLRRIEDRGSDPVPEIQALAPHGKAVPYLPFSNNTQESLVDFRPVRDSRIQDHSYAKARKHGDKSLDVILMRMGQNDRIEAVDAFSPEIGSYDPQAQQVPRRIRLPAAVDEDCPP
jgi:hypothetical protein